MDICITPTTPEQAQAVIDALGAAQNELVRELEGYLKTGRNNLGEKLLGAESFAYKDQLEQRIRANAEQMMSVYAWRNRQAYQKTFRAHKDMPGQVLEVLSELLPLVRQMASDLHRLADRQP